MQNMENIEDNEFDKSLDNLNEVLRDLTYRESVVQKNTIYDLADFMIIQHEEIKRLKEEIQQLRLNKS